MFAVLLAGSYSAYKHFSGLDPLKLDPQAVVKDLLGVRTPQQILTVLSSIKLSPKILEEGSPKDNQNYLEGLTGRTTSTSSVVFKFLLVSDSHSDNINLAKAISQAKANNSDLSFVIGLGDYTNVGTLNELKAAKQELDAVGLRYFLVPGDHDLWDSRDKGKEAVANFKQIFGPNYQSFEFSSKGGSASGGKGYLFILLDNSDNYLGFSSSQLDWVTNELEKGKNEGVAHPSGGGKGIFVFIPIPLYHPSSDHYMGKTESNLKQQAQAMIFQLKNAGVKKVFAGDIHYFSEYEEPVTKLPMVTVGAVATDRNPQAPRYAVVSVFEDGSTKVDDIEIK